MQADVAAEVGQGLAADESHRFGVQRRLGNVFQYPGRPLPHDGLQLTIRGFHGAKTAYAVTTQDYLDCLPAPFATPDLVVDGPQCRRSGCCSVRSLYEARLIALAMSLAVVMYFAECTCANSLDYITVSATHQVIDSTKELPTPIQEALNTNENQTYRTWPYPMMAQRGRSKMHGVEYMSSLSSAEKRYLQAILDMRMAMFWIHFTDATFQENSLRATTLPLVVPNTGPTAIQGKENAGVLGNRV